MRRAGFVCGPLYLKRSFDVSVAAPGAAADPAARALRVELKATEGRKTRQVGKPTFTAHGAAARARVLVLGADVLVLAVGGAASATGDWGFTWVPVCRRLTPRTSARGRRALRKPALEEWPGELRHTFGGRTSAAQLAPLLARWLGEV